MLFRTLFTLAFLSFGAFGAEPSDAERLSGSITKWKDAKEACGGNYSYNVVQSSFTGYRAMTTVVVKANTVVERRFESVTPPMPGMPPQKKEWVETGKDIGTHKGVAEPRTLDELYAIAKKIAEAGVPPSNVRSLGLDKQGLLHHCFFRDTRIADDVPLTGVSPINLTLGKK